MKRTMKTKKITIAGKEVAIAYCYATEIAFRKYTGVNIDQFDASDPGHVLYLILSALIAWSQSQNEEPAVKDEELMYQASPGEIVNALSEVFKLRSEWYEVPAGEPEDETSGEETDEKNA